MERASTQYERNCVLPRLFVSAAVLAGLLCLSCPAIAGANTRNRSKRNEKSAVAPESLQDLWMEHARLVEAGKINETDAVVKAMVLERLRRGIFNLHDYAAALLAESVEFWDRNKKSEAYKLLTQARDLAPDFYGTYYLQARYMWGEGRIFDAISTLATGIRKKYSSFHTAFPAIFNYTWAMLWVYYWALLLLAIFIVVRHAKLVAHDFQERVPGFDRSGATVMAAVLALFPAIFLPNMLLYAFVIILLSWIYISGREKIIAAVLAALLLFVPALFRVMGNGVAAQGEPAFRAVVQIREGAWGENEIAALTGALKSSDESTVGRENVILSLARALAYTNRFEEAISTLNELKGDENTRGFASLLRGDIYYRWEKYPEALKAYEAAAALLPAEAIAHFNLATVLNRPEIVDMNADSLDQSDKEREIARQLDPHLVDIWTSYQDLDPGRVVVDMPISLRRVWNAMMTAAADRDRKRNELFSSFLGGISLKLVPVVALGTLFLMVALSFIEKRISHAHLCRMCGEPYCEKCRSSQGDGSICSRCYHVFEARAGIDPRQRERLRAEVRLKHDRSVLAAEILSIVLPGSGHLLLGKTIRGVVFSMIALTFLMRLVYRNGVLPSEWFMPVQSSLITILLLTFLYIVFVGFTVWNVTWEK